MFLCSGCTFTMFTVNQPIHFVSLLIIVSIDFWFTYLNYKVRSLFSFCLWMVSRHWIASPVCLQTAATLMLQAAVHQEPGLGTRGSLSLSESIGTINVGLKGFYISTIAPGFSVNLCPCRPVRLQECHFHVDTANLQHGQLHLRCFP